MAAVGAPLPRVTIKFCTQCKWMLRAAYFGQELLSTFGTALGEVALQPSTGGTFVVEIFYSEPHAEDDDNAVEVKSHILWDRKTEGGFPETKELKRRVRDVIDPGRDLGHVDGKKKSVASAPDSSSAPSVSESHETPQQLLLSSQDQSVMSGPVPTDKEPLVDESRRKGLHLLGVQEKTEFKPVDIDTVDTKSDGIKRNSDGTICEDCN